MSTTETKAPHPVDVQVGLNIRHRRRFLQMTQEDLAEAVALTFQQIQKYERGANRVSCSKLVEIAAALGCTPASLLPSPSVDPSETAGSWLAEARAVHQEAPRLFEALGAMQPHEIKAITVVAELLTVPARSFPHMKRAALPGREVVQ